MVDINGQACFLDLPAKIDILSNGSGHVIGIRHKGKPGESSSRDQTVSYQSS